MSTATEERTENIEDLNVALNEDTPPEAQVALIPLVGVIRAQSPTQRGQWATVALNEVLVHGHRTDYAGDRVEYVKPCTVWVQWNTPTFDDQFRIEDMIAQYRHQKIRLLVEKTTTKNHEGKEYTNFQVHSLETVEGTPSPVEITLLGETNVHPG